MNETEKLIDRINLDYPALENAKNKLTADGNEACVSEIIKHFSSRKGPNYIFETADMKKCSDAGIIEDAEEIMRHYIYGYQFEGDIDWMFNPTEDTSRDNEWSWSLFRNIYWQPLARAYVATGDEKYAIEFIKQLKSFAKAWPVDNFMHDDTFEAKFKFPGHAWRTIETGMRIYTTWLPCFIAFRSSPSWDKEGWEYFLNMISDHAEFLMIHYSNHDRSSNWLTMESSALLQCGILLPEMKNASTWFNTGYQRVMHELRYSFDNDGIHMERTPIYHMVAAVTYLQAYQLCVKNNIEVAPYALPTLEKCCEFIMRLVKPDFSTPMIGDADRNDLLTRRSDTSVYEGMNLTFDPVDLNEIRAYFKTMYELTGRQDFLYFATARKQGSAPTERNYTMKEAGIYVMRTGWEATDSYYLIHGVSLERGEKSTHSHNDQGHLELHIKGEDVLIDSGRYIYNSSCWKNWRKYFLSANAHNTLFVDDHEMGVVPGVSRVRGVRTFCHNFVENDKYSMIDISHNGYVFMADPIYHRRRVIRLEGDVYIIDDQITGLGKSEHDIRLFFNFAPGGLTKTDATNFVYTTEKNTSFNVISAINNNAEAVILKGSEEPIGGWVSYGYPIRSAIPQLYFKTNGPVPLRFVTVIAPSGVSCTGNGDMKNASLKVSGKVAYDVTFNGEEIIVK